MFACAVTCMHSVVYRQMTTLCIANEWIDSLCWMPISMGEQRCLIRQFVVTLQVPQLDSSEHHGQKLVFATGPRRQPAVQIWIANMGQFWSRPVQKWDLLTLRGPNPNLYPSTGGFHRVWLDPSVPISSSAFRVWHLWSHSDMLPIIVKYW